MDENYIYRLVVTCIEGIAGARRLDDWINSSNGFAADSSSAVARV